MTEEKGRIAAPTLHVHRWGAPWTNDWGLFPLSEAQRQILIQGCESFDSKPTLVEESKEFAETLKQMQAWIDKAPGKQCFFRLSSTSSKDAVPDGKSVAEALCAKTATHIVRQLCTSFRILEDLQEYADCAIVLRAWNEKLASAPEYRTFVQDGKVVGVVRKSDVPLKEKEDPKLLEQITAWVAERAGKLPEPSAGVDVCVVGGSGSGAGSAASTELVFVELNPLDEELDLFGFEGLTIAKSKEDHSGSDSGVESSSEAEED